jgi:proteic killer suppression protein
LELRFKNKALRDLCEKNSIAAKKLGSVVAHKLHTRLADLEAAAKVSDLIAGNPHPLKGNRVEPFALDLAGGWRLVFEAANEPVPRKEDASLDWFRVTIISIEYIGDYHG